MIEYQPTLFDDFKTTLIRRDMERNRRSMFVRYNLMEQKLKEVQEELSFLKRHICKEKIEK